MDGALKRLEAVTRTIQAAAGGGAVAEGEAGPALLGWRDFYKSHVQPFIDACNKIEGTKKIGAWTAEAFGHTGTVIQATQDCAKPSQPDFMKFADPIVKVIGAAGNPDNRAPTFPQEKSFAECVQALSFIMMDGPKAYIMGQLEAADFYLSKVLVAAKDKADDEKQAMRDYVKLIKAMLTEMANWSHDFYKMGLTWKFGGASVLTWKPGAAPAAPTGEAKAETPEARIQAACAALEAAAAGLGKKGGDDDGEGTPVRVSEWNAYYEAHVQPFIDAANKIEGTKKIAAWTEASFKHMAIVLQASAECKKPAQDELMKFLAPVVKIIGDAGNPDSRGPTFPQEKAFAECVQCHSWIFQDLTRPFVQGQLEAADFYLMKVLTTAKDKADDEKKAMQEYVKTLKALMTELGKYCVEHFKTGLEWNGKGVPLADFKGGPAPAAAAPAAAAPAAKPALAGLGAALAAKQGGAAPKKGGFKLPPKAAVLPPSIKTQGDKVFIENYGKDTDTEYTCELIDGKPKVGVFIGKCNGGVVRIKGKAKNITISGCVNAGIVFEDCVTTVEVINSKRCQIQGQNTAGTVMLDKCDRTKVYLPAASCTAPLKALVYTTQCSSTTVFFDGVGEDMEEYGAPEQILSTFELGKPVETIVVIPEADKS